MNPICPVCKKEGKIQYTGGKHTPYVACDKHKVDAIMWAYRQSKRNKSLWSKFIDFLRME